MAATQGNSLNQKEKPTMTYGEKRREEKRKALREYLAGQAYIRDIHADLERSDITDEQLPVIKFKTETRLKLLAKCLPDLARTEMTGEDGGPMQNEMSIKVSFGK